MLKGLKGSRLETEITKEAVGAMMLFNNQRPKENWKM